MGSVKGLMWDTMVFVFFVFPCPLPFRPLYPNSRSRVVGAHKICLIFKNLDAYRVHIPDH